MNELIYEQFIPRTPLLLFYIDNKARITTKEKSKVYSRYEVYEGISYLY